MTEKRVPDSENPAAKEKGMASVTSSEAFEEALVPQEANIISIPEKTELSVEQQIERLEKNIELFNQIKRLSLKLTKESDWVFQGPNSPYLMDRGAENIAIAWGIDISDVTLRMEWAEDEKGRYYTFIASGKAYAKRLGRHVEDIGVCSQRDRFFGMVGGQLKEIHEVDMANIRRKAVTNLYNRLIKRVVGLMNVTIDDLKAAGLDINKIPQIEYKTDKASETKLDKSTLPDYKEKLKEIQNLIQKLSGGNSALEKRFLRVASSFRSKQGKEVYAESIEQLKSEKWIDFTLHNLRKAAQEREPGEEG